MPQPYLKPILETVILSRKPSVPSSKQLLSRMVFQRLEQSTILSWHRGEDGRILAFVECPDCELVEEFISVEAAAAFGTIHRRDFMLSDGVACSLRGERRAIVCLRAYSGDVSALHRQLKAKASSL